MILATISQVAFYTGLLKYIGLCLGITFCTISFFALVITVFAIVRYR